jgi:hypothetical protein
MTRTTETLDTVTVPLAGGRELRCRMYRDGAGEPTDLVISVSWAGGNGWRECAGTIALPPAALADFRDALEALGSG